MPLLRAASFSNVIAPSPSAATVTRMGRLLSASSTAISSYLSPTSSLRLRALKRRPPDAASLPSRKRCLPPCSLKSISPMSKKLSSHGSIESSSYRCSRPGMKRACLRTFVGRVSYLVTSGRSCLAALSLRSPSASKSASSMMSSSPAAGSPSSLLLPSSLSVFELPSFVSERAVGRDRRVGYAALLWGSRLDVCTANALTAVAINASCMDGACLSHAR